MKYQCRIIDENITRQILSINRTTTLEDLPDTLSDCFSKIRAYLDSIGEYPAGSPFVAFHNNDMENLEIEAGYPVKIDVVGKGEIISRKTESGKQVSCVYAGKYAEYDPGHEEILQWIKEHNFQPKGISYEFYHADPTEMPDGKCETEIIFPIQ
jgi:effector-binding domain-containing protein